jgi:hypothetical protein
MMRRLGEKQYQCLQVVYLTAGRDFEEIDGTGEIPVLCSKIIDIATGILADQALETWIVEGEDGGSRSGHGIDDAAGPGLFTLKNVNSFILMLACFGHD